MALHKEPYGLVYNDDGSLCVTLREDDVPFAGVKSFAVEEGTTNLVAPYSYTGDPSQVLFYPAALASGKTWADCWNEEEKAFILGQGITVYRIETNEINLGQTYPAGTKVTISWKHKGYLWFFALFYYDSNAGGFVFWNKDSDEIEIKGDASLDFWENTYGLHIKLNGIGTGYSGEPEKLFDRWYNVEITFTIPVDTDRIKLLFDGYNAYQVNTVGLLRYIQVEVKPFATSFVDGTRPHGILKFTNPLPLDNFVINLWFTPTRYPAQNGYWWHLFNVSYNASAFQGLELTAPPSAQGVIPSNTLSLTVRNSSSTFTRYNFGFDLSKEIGKWHMITLISNGSIVDVYIDGEKRVSATNDVQRSAIEFIVFGRWFGNISGSAPENGFLMSNLLFASYDPAIWTAEYIQELYNMRRPFSIPPKLPII